MPVWRLPDHVADVLPTEARKLEELRRLALDGFRTFGYELVQPPLIEYLDSLLTGSGQDLGLQTFTLVDQLSGRLLGLRADITPQTARIDAHLLNRQGVTRLAYCGPVLHARPRSPLASREPIVLGAELFGYAGWQADLEVLDLLLQTLERVGVTKPILSMSHVGILRAIAQHHGINEIQVNAVVEALGRKDRKAAQDSGLPASALHAVNTLFDAVGPAAQVLAQLRSTPGFPVAVNDAVELLERVADHVQGRCTLLLDIADSHGYHYHTGLTFAVYVASTSAVLARGGRYDTVGSHFGRARPATGFSMYLRDVSAVLPELAQSRAIASEWQDDLQWAAQVTALRHAGEIVVVEFPGEGHEHQEFICDRRLQAADGQWQVVSMEGKAA
jgi:ATP phosphoribosyltransferase regulatory subunit